MIRKYAEIFCWKNVSSFCSAKATHIFSAKNIRILYIKSAKTVNEMTLNKLVKLTMLWTTGPWPGQGTADFPICPYNYIANSADPDQIQCCILSVYTLFACACPLNIIVTCNIWCCLQTVWLYIFQALRSVSWHHEGKQFMASHTDGSLTTWNIRAAGKPCNIMTPHGKIWKNSLYGHPLILDGYYGSGEIRKISTLFFFIKKVTLSGAMHIML